MRYSSELQSILSQFFNWNKPRLDCLAQILKATVTLRTVNLQQLAGAFDNKAKRESSYRRICRFFTSFSFDVSLIVTLVFRLFPLGNHFCLILDRTNWKWGKTPINLLVLSLGYKGISLPLFWSALPLEGNSCTEERVSLLRAALDRIDPNKIRVLLADREFIGEEWFNFLHEQKIPFLIRNKKNTVVRSPEGIKLRVEDLCKYLRKKRLKNYQANLWGHEVYVSVRKAKGAKEPIILISNDKFSDPLELYRMRWEIETMFSCLKSRGFRMEETHMTDPDKIEKLLFVLAIGFCWAYRNGDIKAAKNPIEIKKHGRPAKSLFRLGLDGIQEAFLTRINLEVFKEILICFTPLEQRNCA